MPFSPMPFRKGFDPKGRGGCLPAASIEVGWTLRFNFGERAFKFNPSGYASVHEGCDLPARTPALARRAGGR